ncbi:MAG: type II toxin-antitoxin system HicB family antitoxin [Solobacterium sp.]|nr:type II toxin-antitoxin system HicB family antitoxin [Solobacterium sp.]
MSTVSYPAIFHPEENGYWVEFPDLPGCFSQGNSIEESYAMASEALGVYLDHSDDVFEREIPMPTSMDLVIKDNKNDIVMLVTFDSLEYARRHRTRAVKKTLSIPEWLNDLAVKENVNFSQVLQDALIEKLYRK